MGRKTEFSGLGLLRMRVGVQPIGATCWRINRRDEDALRTAARQGVRNSYLRRTPKSNEKSPLATSGVTHGIAFRHFGEDKRREL